MAVNVQTHPELFPQGNLAQADVRAVIQKFLPMDGSRPFNGVESFADRAAIIRRLFSISSAYPENHAQLAVEASALRKSIYDDLRAKKQRISKFPEYADAVATLFDAIEMSSVKPKKWHQVAEYDAERLAKSHPEISVLMFAVALDGYHAEIANQLSATQRRNILLGCGAMPDIAVDL